MECDGRCRVVRTRYIQRGEREVEYCQYLRSVSDAVLALSRNIVDLTACSVYLYRSVTARAETGLWASAKRDPPTPRGPRHRASIVRTHVRTVPSRRRGSASATPAPEARCTRSRTRDTSKSRGRAGEPSATHSPLHVTARPRGAAANAGATHTPAHDRCHAPGNYHAPPTVQRTGARPRTSDASELPPSPGMCGPIRWLAVAVTVTVAALWLRC